VTSAAKKETFGIPSKRGLKKGLETTVILQFGYCFVNALITGTDIATSPIADRRIIKT
jgi:hypothetical protein